MDTQKLNVMPREERGSAAARRLRRSGRLPANLSGLEAGPLAITIPEHEFELLQQHNVRLVAFELDGNPVEALIRDVQHDTFGDKVLHVDLERIERGESIEVEVAFDFFGEPAGAEEGGVFQVLMDAVTVECLPSAIPESIEIDVRKLAIGDEIRLRDVTFPEGVKPVDLDPEELVALVSEPEGEEEAAEGEEILGEGAASEPELIRRKEAEEEGED